MENIVTWSDETLNLVKNALQKDATTQGYSNDMNLTGIELAPYARVLIPALTPFRNSVPRVQAPKGSKTSIWRSILSANTTNVRATVALGGAGVVPLTKEADFLAAYALISQGGKVMDDAQTLAQGFDDARALSVQNTLIDLMKQEEILLLGGQNFALGAVSAPTLTPAASGGTIGAVNVGVAVAARTLQGVQDGQSTAASTPTTSGALTGTTNSIGATVPYVPGAYCYDWYVGTSGGTLYYYGTTVVNSITITSVPTAAAAVTGAPSVQSIPGYNTVNPTDGTITFTAITTAALCSTDRSADANAFNGLTATLVGDFKYVGNANIIVKNGTGDMPSGAYIKSLNGAALTGNSGTIYEIDEALDVLWQLFKVSPSKIYCNSRTRRAINDKMVASGGYTTLAPIQSPDVRRAAVGGIMETQYMNKSGEGYLDIVPLPWIPEGTIIIASEKLSFPNSRITNVFEVETQREYYLYPYSAGRSYGVNGGPRYEYDDRAIETFKNFFSGAHAILQNVGR
jgi:hypothetical protein